MPLSIRRREHLAFSPLAVPGGLEAWYAPYRGGLVVSSLGEVSRIADLSGRGRDLVSGATAATRPILSNEKGVGNHVQYSEDLTQTSAYAVTGATVNDATTVTLPATKKIEFGAAVLPGVVCTLTFKAKLISGTSPNLTLLSQNCTVASQVLTLTGTLDQYTFTFTVSSTINAVPLFGIQNSSATNSAQINLTNVQVTETSDTTYLQTLGAPRIPLLASGKRFVRFGRDSLTAPSAAFASANWGLAQPWTLYLLGARRRGGNGGGSANWSDGVASVNCGALSENGGTRDLRVVANTIGATATNPATDGNFAVISAVFNGTNSFIQFNRGTPGTADSGAQNPGGLTLGTRQDAGRTSGFDFLEAIVRSGADDAAQRNVFQLYLANVAGIVI